MKYLLGLLCFLFVSANALLAQRAYRPQPELKIEKPKSEYQTLYEKYERDDATLSDDELLKLYLQFSLQPVYNPYDNRWADSVAAAETRNDAFAANEYVDSLLFYHPFSLWGNEAKARLLSQKQPADTLTAQRYLKRANRIAAVVNASGTGADYANAFLITHHLEIPQFMRRMGYEGLQNNYREVKGVYYQLTTARETKTGKVTVLYFDLSRTFNILNKYRAEMK